MGRMLIFDTIRRKYVTLTPEEWVRQNFVRYLSEEKGYPLPLMAIEAGFRLYKTSKRTDILIHNRMGYPIAIVECKAPDVPITSTVFDQIIRYNISFNINYLMVTNGMSHYCCRVDHHLGRTQFLQQIPDFEVIIEG